MKYLDFLEQVAVKSEYQKGETKDIARLVFEELAELILDGDSVTIPHFGTFTKDYIRPRFGYDFSTHEMREYPKTPVPKWRPSKGFREKVKASGDA